MKSGWREYSTLQKIGFVLRVSLSLFIILLAVWQLFGWENAIYVYMPLTAVLTLLQGFDNRKIQRAVSIINFVAAGFLLVCTFMLYFVR